MKYLVFGLVCMDYYSMVDEYLKEDSKIRNSSSLIQLGGNAWNHLLTLSFLLQHYHANFDISFHTFFPKNWIGIPLLQQFPHLQKLIFNGFSDQSNNTNNSTAPFSYILVNQSNQTRTIIHTPLCQTFDSPNQLTNETQQQISQLISQFQSHTNFTNFDFIFLDGRFTMYAAQLLPHFSQSIIWLECEKQRYQLDTCISMAQILSCSFDFILQHSTQEDISETLLQLWNQMKKKRKDSFIIVTLGQLGSIICFQKEEMQKYNSQDWNWKELITQNKPKQGVMNSVLQYCYCPIFKEESSSHLIKDTTGSGDVFHASCCFYYLYTIDKEKQCNYMNMLEFASQMAYYKCLEVGVSGAIWKEFSLPTL